jgi:hypothetical protein
MNLKYNIRRLFKNNINSLKTFFSHEFLNIKVIIDVPYFYTKYNHLIIQKYFLLHYRLIILIQYIWKFTEKMQRNNIREIK